MKRFVGIALSALVLMGATGCKDSPGVSGATPPPAQPALPSQPQKKANLPTPCSLVSATDAKTVIAQTMTEMSNDDKLCMYASADQPGNFTSMLVNLSWADDNDMASQIYRGIAGLPGKLNKMTNDQVGSKTKKSGRALDGVGDEAWLSSGNMDVMGSASVVVRKGLVVLNITVSGMGTDPAIAERLEALARKVVTQL
nr:hypothetical protein [uncultured Rhodoferax sp.]